MSRLKASAPGGKKNGSFLPQTASSGGRQAEIFLKFWIERRTYMVFHDVLAQETVARAELRGQTSGCDRCFLFAQPGAGVQATG